jgi:hypothetical protein
MWPCKNEFAMKAYEEICIAVLNQGCQRQKILPDCADLEGYCRDLSYCRLCWAFITIYFLEHQALLPL